MERNLAGQAIRCRIFTDAEAMLSMESEWRQLFQEALYATPFSCWEWAQAWWQHFGAPTISGPQPFSLLIIAIYETRESEEELIGLAPCYYTTGSEVSGRARVLRLFGDMGAKGNSLTEERVALLKKGREKEAASALLSLLRRRTLPGDWDFFHIRLPYWPTRTTPNPSLRTNMRRGLLQKQTLSTEMLELPRCWEAYRQNLSKSMRDNLAYYPRLLTRHGYDWAIRSIIASNEIIAATGHLIDLHRMREKSLRGIPHSNHIPGPAYRACLQSCLTELAAVRMARILLLEVGGRPVAALSLLENAGIMTVYYSGFDPAFYNYSPLTILIAEAIRSAIERGIYEVNFLAGTSRWNARWGASSQPLLQQIIGLRMKPRSLLSAALYLAKRSEL